MKNILSILLVLVISNTLNAQGINFEHTTFKEALSKAKAENKMLFMDCFTTWCGPCKKMSKEVFPQKEVGDYINANFVSIKMDMEKGEGIDLTKYYNVKAFPTLLFMDANGKVLHTKVGGLDTEAFIEEAKKASDPTKQFAYIEKQYLDGNRDLKVVSEYIKGLYDGFKMDAAKVVGKDIIPSLTKEQYSTEEGFTILAYTGVGYNSEPYKYVLKNKDKLIANEKIGQESVDYLVSNAINDYVMEVVKTGTLEEVKAAIETTKKDFVSPYQDMMENNWIHEFYLANKQFEKWFDSNIKQAESEADKNTKQRILINTCYRVATDSIFEPNNEICNKAIHAIEKLKADNKDFLASYYCLATLYKKAGNKESALININDYARKCEEQDVEISSRAKDLKSEIEKI
ncbi:thiol:disulfide interchange protein precursor [Mariniflexile rhizosphaerae]|uniref:thioredoxin family protein n=1 Tax=unclassified Mariniflexile TaxID=2643887 RepID=UPI000CCB4261|nr:thioredoxin family protein [Mariniflexile sp. TRM1-10]AXP82173.1 thiol:disulfide interchange protein precursor [Mariniflexile sp. TRM1-10]PLB19265.1 MAG: Thioredoxin domain-containing protein [Flavobacteriaceae bacterium FS1-H7996/R]